MLIDNESLLALCRRCRGVARPIYGEMLVFFEHTAAARRFADLARADGYELDLFGTQAHVHTWTDTDLHAGGLS
jgi:hypothetical protein